MSIIWLASYPRSGSSWMRALLTNYRRDGRSPASINNLDGGMLHSRRLFDDLLGLPSSDLTDEEVLRLRPQPHELLARELPHPTIATVHDAYVRTAAGPLFPRAATAGAIVLVRNPLDIAVSYAHHLQLPIDETTALMTRSDAARTPPRRNIHPIFEDLGFSWSAHVASWLEAGLRTLVVRYEDMLAAPSRAFGAAIRFTTGLEWNAARLTRAVRHSRFDRLRAQEERNGFSERHPGSPAYFRTGRAGGWRATLRPEHVGALVDAHAPVMARFGYLEEAAAFLGAADARRSAQAPTPTSSSGGDGAAPVVPAPTQPTPTLSNGRPPAAVDGAGSMRASRFLYSAYGLCVRSAIRLPGRTAPRDAVPAVDIRIGRVPEERTPSTRSGKPWQAAPGIFRLDVEGSARYLVREGREIVMEPTGGSEADVRAFLLGPVLAACLQQRGVLTLHASAIESDGGAVLFVGPAGAGKSTLAAGLLDRGFRLLADGTAGVILDADLQPIALPGFPALGLWKDVANDLSWGNRIAGPVRGGMQKYVAPVERFRPTPLPVRAVFLLGPHNRREIEIRTVPRRAAFEALLPGTYRIRFLQGMGRQREHFRILTTVARQARISSLEWPSHPFRPAALADEVGRRLRADAS